MDELNNETIQLILSERTTEDFWLFQLGKSESSISIDGEHQFLNSFFDNGQRLWNFYQDKMKSALCDSSLHQPKEFVREITEGTVKEIVTSVVSVLCTTYSLSLAVAIPLCALILKKGINNFCAE